MLVAEDHEGLRQAAHEMPVSHGYQVVFKSASRQSLCTCAAHGERIRWALLEATLPQPRGAPALFRIRHETLGLSVSSAGYGVDIAETERVKRVCPCF